MKYLNYPAPYVDELIKSAQQDFIVKDKNHIKKLLEIIKNIRMLEVQGDDEMRSIWIETERGKIDDFGNYKEYLEGDIITNHEEFVELWKCYYLGVRDIKEGTSQLISYEEVMAELGIIDYRAPKEKEKDYKEYERISVRNKKIYKILLEGWTDI